MQTLRIKLRIILFDNSSKGGKVFDYFIQLLIFVSLISISVETLPNNSEETKLILKITESICIAIFSIEYLARIFSAKNAWKYIFSFYGIIDLLAILPFYVGSIIDMRAVRAFRVFRLFRILKLIRYNRALHRFNTAAKIVHEEIILFFIVTGIFIFLTASGIYYFENEAQPEVFTSVFHSLWWAIVTLTTVGYGDVYPITIGGKVFTFFVLIIGVGIVTVPAGLIASALSKARDMEEKERKGDC